MSRGLPATGRTGINVWVPVPDETAAVARLRSDGYAVAPGALFRQAAGPGLRITVSNLRPSDIEPAGRRRDSRRHGEPRAPLLGLTRGRSAR